MLAELTRLICVYPSQPYLNQLNPALLSATQTSSLLLPAAPVILKLTCMQLHALFCMSYVPGRMHAPHHHYLPRNQHLPSPAFISFTPETGRWFALYFVPSHGLLAMSSLISMPGWLLQLLPPYTIFIGWNACLILPPKLCFDLILACGIKFLSSLFLPQSRSLLPHATDPILVQTSGFLKNRIIGLMTS
jgi:hypothetical protein